ncbi:hypothetical protein IT407_03130 [Candidatus Uhrbacteria bacterium]|nr:hypothetical protein [Candidatus Uhrbacteria bacterium]
MRSRQENLSAEMRYELPIGMDFERAKLIMGEERFFGAEKTRARIDWSIGFDEKEMGPIPFSPKELHDAVEEGKYLIHRFSKDISGNDVTMTYLRMNAPDSLPQKKSLEGLYAGSEGRNLQDMSVKSGWYLSSLRTDRVFSPHAKQPIEPGHSLAEFYYDGIITGDFQNNFNKNQVTNTTVKVLTNTKTPNGMRLAVAIAYSRASNFHTIVEPVSSQRGTYLMTSQRNS